MIENKTKEVGQQKLLFVQGIQKTGTSTLVGILNCCPDVFLLYEARLNQALVSRYGNQILERFPESRKFFRHVTDLGRPYREFFDFIATRFPGHSFQYVGDKLIDFNVDLTDSCQQSKVIFTLRDIRSWLVKEQIVRYYRTDLDVVPATIQYLHYLIGTYRKRDACRIWMEDLIEENDKTIDRLGKSLDLDLAQWTDRWWERTATTDLQDPKSLSNWSQGHPSSRMPPTKLDTKVKIRTNVFWDDLLQIFQRYFRKPDVVRLPSEISDDQVAINQLWNYSPLPLSKCYDEIDTSRFRISPPPRTVDSTDASSKNPTPRFRDRIKRNLKRLIGQRTA